MRASRGVRARRVTPATYYSIRSLTKGWHHGVQCSQCRCGWQSYGHTSMTQDDRKLDLGTEHTWLMLEPNLASLFSLASAYRVPMISKAGVFQASFRRLILLRFIYLTLFTIIPRTHTFIDTAQFPS